MELGITQQILLAGFLLAAFMGAVVNKTNFCTMGAVSDLVNMGDMGRMRSWMLAIAVAIIGLTVIETIGWVDLDALENSQLRPPYRMASFDWMRYILGGTMFGVGMTLASGCANKTLVRIGGGNIKSVVVLLVASFFAYLMQFTSFYEVLFYNWLNPLAIDLTLRDISHQDLGTVASVATGFDNPILLRQVIGGFIAASLLYFIFKSADFRSSFDNILGGTVVGASVVGAWYVTGGDMGMEWMEEVLMMDEPPFGVGTQAFSFTNPMSDTFNLAVNKGDLNYVTFGVMALSGVIAGSFLYSVIFKKFRFEWFSSTRDFINHVVGGALMGIGGILALGCTIGQGVTGASTLAIGSFMALFSIIFGSALTMKIQYYKMVYENEASFFGAFISSLVDMKLLPGKMRKLEPV
jgi:uncharacterized membrane protein YedE/YeeE